MIMEILTGISIGLSAYQVYQNSKKGDKDKSTLLAQMRSLFDDLRFSKITHSTFWEFNYFTFKQFIDDTKGITDLKVIKREWEAVRFFYDNHIDEEVVSLLPTKLQFEEVDGAQVALTVKTNVKEISRQYPRLLQHINNFVEQYKKQGNEIFEEERVKDFKEINDNLLRLNREIISDADRLIHNYVGFLIFIYDNVFPKTKK